MASALTKPDSSIGRRALAPGCSPDEPGASARRLVDPIQNTAVEEPTTGATKDIALTDVSVIVPLFNERDCVNSLVDSLTQLERSLVEQFELEFLLVDDGSTDETVQLLRESIDGRPHWRLVEHGTNRGITAAIQTGLCAARHEIAVSMDCDGSYDASLIAEMVPRLTPGVDLVTASPYHPAGSVENVPLWRLRLSRLASRLYGVVCRHKLTCYTSCFRVYRRSAVAPLKVENEGFVGVAELLCKVLERGGGVVEQPAILRSRVGGHSKMRVVRAGLGHLRLMARMLASRVASSTCKAINRNR